ncbi:MAG: phosphatase PAP2 family protein [Abditibacteriota bacterium]|nr:phosphatase PAP2 family protein [Abditibacteriota bacterium]
MLIIAALINCLKYTPFGLLTPRPSGYEGGFPSGHTATSFAMAYFVSLKVPRLIWFMFFLAAAIGFSRLFAGSEHAAHYPYQIISGSLFGSYLAWGIDLLMQKRQAKKGLPKA